MITKKKATKLIIIIILFVFLVITGLSAVVPYLGKTTTGTGDIISGDVVSGAIVESGISDVNTDSGMVETPALTKEEASQKLQQLLSGLSTSGAAQ